MRGVVSDALVGQTGIAEYQRRAKFIKSLPASEVPEGRKVTRAHRFLMERRLSGIAPALVVMHTCDNRACVLIDNSLRCCKDEGPCTDNFQCCGGLCFQGSCFQN